MPDLIHPVILCGGLGARLWPLSRRAFPKQFTRLLGDRSPFQATVERLSGPGFAAPLAVTAEEFRFLLADQLAEIDRAAPRILVEPEPRNTASAVLAAALALQAGDPEALMLVAPSDHAIRDEDAFRAAVAAGVAAALEGRIVVFGVRPDRPETGYGWIEPDIAAAAPAPGCLAVARFIEKPDAERAAAFLGSNRFLWNAGVFLMRARDCVAAFEAQAPEMIASVRAALAGARGNVGVVGGGGEGLVVLAAEPWREIEAISFDHAVIERLPADAIAATPCDCGWSDLGAWDAVHRETAGADGVAAAGPVTAIDCRDVLLRAEDPDQRVVAIGLENVAVVAMRDAVLVADLRDAQTLREAVAALKAERAPQAESFPRVHRPWGWYETLALGSRFQVKRICVRPGGRLSLQSHVHRAEHWVVVEGTAQVTVGDAVRLLGENESVYVPLGAVHRLENPGRLPLLMIEVQSGAYLGEDDIVRYEDVYGRIAAE